MSDTQEMGGARSTRAPRPARSTLGRVGATGPHRGANHWTLEVYEALWDAGEEGMTLPALVDACVEKFNYSGIHEWWRDLVTAGVAAPEMMTGYVSSVMVDGYTYPADADYRTMVLARVRATTHGLKVRGSITSTGHSNSKADPTTYYANRDNPPRQWVRPMGHTGMVVPFNPDAERAKNRAIVEAHAWELDARMEMGRAKPRPAVLADLVERALVLFGSKPVDA